MAIRFARQAGNWSDPLTWDDGLTIPTTGDEVYLNNYNITIDQDITTGFITNSQTPIGVPLDPIPDMTSNTSPVGVGQAFATQNSINAWKVFVKGLNTFIVINSTAIGWLSGINNTGQIGYQFNTPKSIQRYSIYNTLTNAGQRPSTWTFEGSNDGVTWTILHTVTGLPSVNYYISPSISNPSSYTYYRVNVTATVGGGQVHIYYISMSESTSFGDGYLSGGTTTISTSRTVNTDLYHKTGTLMTISATSPDVVNITGNIPGTIPNSYCRAMTLSGNCTLNFVGNIVGTAPSVGARQDVKGIVLTAPATLNVTGDVYGGTNIQTGTTSSENVGIQSLTTAAVINVVGNLDGGTGQRNRAIQTSTNDTLTVTGNVFGGTGSGTSSPISGILLNSFSSIPCSIVGSVSSGLDSYGVLGGSFGSPQLKITGNVINHSTGRMAVYNVQFVFLESTNMSWEFRKSNLTTNTLYTPGVATGHPAEANVRTGVTYGPTNNLTGTCAVPPAAAVSIGVPVDNTTGTAYLNPTDIWNVPLASITTPNSIGERLKDASTVQTTGAQLAAFLP